MERAQRSIGALNKDQLLVESRNSQQVNALINLHMTANPPANVIPILTLVQLKVNVLKAQVENLINARLMENQGLEVRYTIPKLTKIVRTKFLLIIVNELIVDIYI